ncbi:MAG TPA: rRNA maturation RNase YbeY [Pirellulales bacterium]|nr:rRNA maturation RNase YbeY [Pirellulales bacterium]
MSNSPHPISDAVPSIVVEITNRQDRHAISKSQLAESIRAVLLGEGLQRAHISLVVVDDRTIQELNRRFLQHDESTDVLSFPLEHGDGFVEGEIVVSADTAARTAQRFGWSADNELLLYAIHGALHLVEYDDQTAAAKEKMRRRERFYLRQFGLSPRYKEGCP